MKKKILCLVLALCAALVLTSCGQQQEEFPNQPRQDSGANQQAAVMQEAAEPEEEAPVQSFNFDDGSYNPASEEDESAEEIISSGVTSAPMIQSEYAGATPVKIDPVDKPTPTPLPAVAFSYTTYTASNLHLSFDGPAGWIVDDTAADTYTLTYPDNTMDYTAKVEIRKADVGKNYSQKELIKEAKAQADALRGTGAFKSFDPSNTAARHFIDGNGVYLTYSGVLKDENETGVSGRIIVNTVNKTLYILHVSYPRGLANTFAEGVYNKIRHTMKLAN